jgi:hypothetical protein
MGLQQVRGKEKPPELAESDKDVNGGHWVFFVGAADKLSALLVLSLSRGDCQGEDGRVEVPYGKLGGSLVACFILVVRGFKLRISRPDPAG